MSKTLGLEPRLTPFVAHTTRSALDNHKVNHGPSGDDFRCRIKEMSGRQTELETYMSYVTAPFKLHSSRLRNMYRSMRGTKPTADAGCYTARGSGRKFEEGCKGMVIEMRVARIARLAKMARGFSCGMLKIEGVPYKMFKSFEGRDGEEGKTTVLGCGFATPLLCPGSAHSRAAQLVEHVPFTCWFCNGWANSSLQ